MTYEFSESNASFIEIKAQELAINHVLSSRKPKPIPLLVALPQIPNWLINAKKSFRSFVKTSKLPSMMHFLLPARITLLFDLLPKSSCNAPTTIDLPAPVSPVMTLKPRLNSIFNSAINK